LNAILAWKMSCEERPMMMRACFWLAVMSSLMGLTACAELGESVDRGPRYTVEAFKRQWNVKSPHPKARFNTLHKYGNGLIAEYGDGVTLFLTVQKETVTGARVRYVLGTDQGAGGPLFLHLVQTAINVGTFRWPPERVEHVRRTIGLGIQPKSYRYLYTSFVCTHEQQDTWEFIMDFVVNKPEADTPGPLPSQERTDQE
jgi:hypothetical protein